jgi:aspartate racemase
MKTLGLIGGTSWHSTVEYYRLINKGVHERLGAMHSAKLLLYSLDFEEYKPAPGPVHRKRMADILVGIAVTLEKAGAECLVLCANTSHMLADTIQENTGIPIVHIAEATGVEIKKQGLKKIALLGTRFTMEEPFFRDRLAAHGIETVVPIGDDGDFIHDSIINELVNGVFTEETRQGYIDVIQNLVGQGAEGVILGCTEIPLLLKPGDCPVPVFDTLQIHANAAVDFALS